jgi:ferredoxin-nitrite reductase/sulfite reductase (ferredoxin)
VGFRTPAHLVPEAIERLLRKYLVERDSGENLRAYFARNSDADLRAALAGEEIIPVERDLPDGRVPVELAG